MSVLQPYKSDHNTGVSAFAIGDDFILVKFKDRPGPYLYNYDKPGKQHVDRMKRLALKGKGLTTYINQNVRTNYSRGPGK
ncbi:MAG: hypothetical protein ACTHMI_16285 [Mucilaginibacter sp.]